MNKLRIKVLRVASFFLALQVLLLSCGFTYHSNICTCQSSEVYSVQNQETATCCSTFEKVDCCKEAAQNSCGLFFSTYIHFDFDTNNTSKQVRFLTQHEWTSRVVSLIVKSTSIKPLQKLAKEALPPKSSKQLLCFIQSFLI